jgi:uncharacterized protein
MKPIIDGHAYLSVRDNEGICPEDKIVHGVTGQEVFYDEKDGMLKSNLAFFSKHMNREMENGKKQISIGASCLYRKQNGVYNGQDYEVVQEDITGNHVAIVNNGRSGSLVAVLDQAETNQEAVEKMTEVETKKVEDESEDKTVKQALQDCMDAINEIREEVRTLKAEKTAAEDESESDKKNSAEDESEEDKKDEYKAKAMDEKEFLLRSAERETFANKLSEHITIPNKETLTISEIAQYGVKKLKEIGHNIKCVAGNEISFLEGFLLAKAPPKPVSLAMDSTEKKQEESIDILAAYKKGEI